MLLDTEALMKMAQTTAETKLAKYVKEILSPSIKTFVDDLTDDELLQLLKQFSAMNIDLIKDLTNAAKERKIATKQWTEDSPFDDIINEI